MTIELPEKSPTDARLQSRLIREVESAHRTVHQLHDRQLAQAADAASWAMASLGVRASTQRPPAPRAG